MNEELECFVQESTKRHAFHTPSLSIIQRIDLGIVNSK
jgi:hypothetical protein